MNQMAEISAKQPEGNGQAGNKEVIILSVERSGTNFFCECLGEFSEAARYFEFFAKDKVYGLNANPRMHKPLSDALGFDVRDEADDRLVREVASAPIKHLNIFSHASRQIGAKFLSLKIFPGQVEFSKLRLALTGPNKRVIFITRSRLDCFISFQKALTTDTWQNLDTSDMRPELDYGEFVRWAVAQDEWYNRAEKVLRESGTPYTIFSYEADIDGPKERLVEKQYFALRSFGIDVDVPQDTRPTHFTKQDRATDPFEKIRNGEAFRASLEAADALQFALAKPLLG